VGHIARSIAVGALASPQAHLADVRPSRRRSPSDWFAEQSAISLSRLKARALAALFPRGFSRALPRGYTLVGGELVMLKVESSGGQKIALYGPHRQWLNAESAAFEHDLATGMLTEIAASMRWYLRADPQGNADFQTGLSRLREAWEAESNRFS
jgi:hypothetical protein